MDIHAATILVIDDQIANWRLSWITGRGWFSDPGGAGWASGIERASLPSQT